MVIAVHIQVLVCFYLDVSMFVCVDHPNHDALVMLLGDSSKFRNVNLSGNDAVAVVILKARAC